MMKILDTVWTEANCRKLRNWWEIDGLTSNEVVLEFGKLGYQISRNAIIGKVHRLKLVAPGEKRGLSSEKRSAAMKKANAMRSLRPTIRRRPFPTEKKYNPQPPPEPPISATNPPKGNKAVLLKHSKDGQCKAIIGYVHGKLELAVYCGEKTPPVRRHGELVSSPWCDYHKSIYLTEPRR